MVPFTLKYIPKTTAEIFGQEKSLATLRDFITNYKQKKYKAALVYGPIGVGKTSAIQALANELNYDLLEINSSDLRNAENISSFLNSALGQQSLFFRPKIILIDEIDNLSGTKDRGCIPEIVKAIEKSSFPVIMTANDIFEPKLKPLKTKALLIEFEKLSNLSIIKAIRSICEQEKIPYEEKAISSLSRQADGDLRAALIDLQVLSNGRVSFEEVMLLSDRKRKTLITSSLQIIFKSSSVETALTSLDNLDVDLNEVFLWIDENLHLEFTKPEHLEEAYCQLSRADVFRGRISRKQHWHFLAYINNLLSAGVSSAKEKKEAGFIKYRPTTRLLKIWQINIKNAKKKEVAEKLAELIHASRSKALQHFALFRIVINNSKDNGVIKELELSSDELVWLKNN